MNSKPNIPDEIWLGKAEYSLWTDWKVNGWLFLAAIISGVCDILFPHQISQWPLGLRVVVAMVPFLALLLWVRSLARWIGGMDELHRRITLAAVLFTTGASFFVVMAWHRLDKAGVFQALFPPGRNPDASWDIATVGHVFLLMTLFYFCSYAVFNRRYR